MKMMTAVILACGLAGVAQAQNIDVTLTGTLDLTSGVDLAGLDGASFVMTASFDSNGTWQDLFGLPSADATSQGLSVGGSAIGFNENLAYFPTFAGAFSTPDGNHLTFNSGGSLLQFFGNVNPAPGSGDAFVGGSIELDDFDGATYVGTGGSTSVTDLTSGTTYTLSNAVFTAVIPAPAGVALLGLGGLVATRRRR